MVKKAARNIPQVPERILDAPEILDDYCKFIFTLGQIKKCVFRVRGLKILGRIGTLFFLEKNIILCILKGISPFKMYQILFFPENLKKILGFTSKFR